MATIPIRLCLLRLLDTTTGLRDGVNLALEDSEKCFERLVDVLGE